MYLQLIVVATLISPIFAKVNCAEKLKECETRGPNRPVCGTDSRTYPTRCHLLKIKCHGSNPNLSVVHRGPCTGNKQPCWADKNGKEGEGGIVFVPKCLSDGRYAPVQCHEGTGYCWCVTAEGKPLPNTSVRHAKPKCNRRGKMRRVSGMRNQKPRKECGRIERSNFINNLIRSFTVEFNRTTNLPKNASELELEKLAVSWKFSTLDKDSNKTLTRDEYRDLRKLVRKVVKPKKCARSFSRFCDSDRDTFITLEEWTKCLERRTIKRTRGSKKKNPDGELGVIQDSVSLLTSHTPTDPGVKEPAEDPEVNDCLSDRKSALEEQSNMESYVPECALDGRFQKIQCYKSTGYCWCVHEDTGKPIPGTSVKDLNPKCDAVQPPSRPMKGCPEHRKHIFLKDLMDFLTQTMEEHKPSGSDKGLLLIDQQPLNEQIAAWNFHALDTNKNKVLERKEWKTFRTMISTQKKLRRCGKKLPRYCDVNHDRKISMTEWLNCLNSSKNSSSITATTSSRRRGPNPIESYLKDDD